ncbi:ABC transporter substrate-binding protein [Sorangium sp. So ce327]|jgi:branched-chain amino acid transport system substrate-binding protein|uniref:ABC transporter substrate-binding protein n=1 Tax=Sorangium sp. So ce327 TaxID=3133301 RepID=UPI003F5F6DB8
MTSRILSLVGVGVLCALAAACDKKAGAAGASSQAESGKPPILIGITADASGQYANSGDSDKRGIIMAIEEANARGGVLGRPVKWVHMDTETTPATGSRVAERMIKQDKVAFLVGGVSSGVANAISQVAQKYGVIYLNTNSSSATEAGENCHRVKFVWDANGSNFTQASTKGAIEKFGKKWLLLTNDYVWGHDTAKATKKVVMDNGGEIIDEILVPQGTRDFSAILLKVQQKAPSVIAAAVGGDDLKALRAQVAQIKLGDKYAWINNQQDWPDIYGLPRTDLFGVFGTTWYQGLDLPGVKEFNARYAKANPDSKIKTPGNVFYNGYWATRSLLEAVERAKTTKNHAVIKELEGLKIPAKDRMQHHDAYMNPATHQLQQTIYLATADLESQNPDELFKILSHADPSQVVDRDADAKCKLEPIESTPVYEP